MEDIFAKGVRFLKERRLDEHGLVGTVTVCKISTDKPVKNTGNEAYK